MIAQRADTEVRAPATLVLGPCDAMFGCMRIGFPGRAVWLPIGAGAFGRMPIGADTEVRPPATLFLGPGARCARMDDQRTGDEPIQILSLPIGAGVFGGAPSGADTEVRAPATLVLDPFSAMGGWARIGFPGRAVWLPMGAGVFG